MTVEVSIVSRPFVSWSFITRFAIIWCTLALIAILAVTTPQFASVENLTNIVNQQGPVLIVASVMTLTVIAGGFDVSLSAIAILSPLIAFRVENNTHSIPLTIAAGCLTGLIAGVLNGLVVAGLRINSFIATLASSLALFGVGYIVSDSSILRPSDSSLRDLATRSILGLEAATWVAIGVVAVAWFVLERTRFGRHVFAVGGNAEASRLAGISVFGVVVTTFVLGGLAAGLAGTIQAAQAASAQASDDYSFVFAVIAGVVIGGTSIAGGEGAVWRSVVGVMFIALLVNGFNLNGIDPIYQRIIQGLVILAAVGVDGWTRNRHRS